MYLISNSQKNSLQIYYFLLILVSMIRQDYDPSAISMLINKTLY